jgi:ATP adenylyltransferase
VDHLWSPWRLEYVISKKPEGCVFCLPAGALAKAGHAPNPSNPDLSAGASAQADPLVVHQGQLAYVILNLYPYNNGHLMVVPYRHESSLAGLTRDEMNDVGLLTQLSERALREAYKLEGINVGVNLGAPAGAGIEQHVHLHLVPRWNGDTNFMTVVGATRVLPEDIRSTAERLRPIFARLSSS